MNLLVLDNFDSFTYTLVDYLRQAGAVCTVVRNDASLASITARSFDGVVLSPGPGTPQRAGNLMAVVEYYHARLPMLGVCLGQQALGEFFGATLGLADRPMHGKVSAIRVDTGDELFQNMPGQFNITRYHSLVLQTLPLALRQLAVTKAGEVMAIRHRTWPVWGVQFHPEAVLTEYGLVLIKNWVGVVKKSIKKETAASVAADQ
ncbi:MAG: aminodeoxychorismate/anthranilate synthase component II [Bacteroidetes bacterium]|nr:aminodeoxychorismate/anthranilate synthase component II [Fibrella sp.]